MSSQNTFRTRAVLWLTLIVTSFSIVASFGGLFIEGLYRDSEFIKRAWLANDWVTLFIAPLLPLTLFLHKRGDDRSQLVWMGLMLYMFYNYAFYLFGASFNKFFLLYVILFSASMYSLIIGLLTIDTHAIHNHPVNRNRKLAASMFLSLLAVPLLFVELKQCIHFIVSGKNPEVPTLIFALDLSIVIPTTILASVLLWKNRPWGNVLAIMTLVKSFAYGSVLVAAAIIIHVSEAGPLDPLLPFYASLVVGGLVFGILLLYDLKPSHGS